jgi:molybdate transport system substrate-binding protein
VLLRSVRATVVIASVVALLIGTVGCSAGHDAGRDTGTGGGDTAATPDALRGTVTVFAAASLQQTFTTIGHDFERAHPGTTVRFSFAGSSDLATQIESGAPADVFAAADQASMAKLPADLLSGSPGAFATNVLEIAVAPGNPLGIRTLDDLTADDVQLVTCATPVPCGAATARVERAAGVALRPVSEEQSVTDVLGKVESGQADAGLVYVTDVRGAGRKVTGVPIAAADRAVNTYPIGVLRDAADPALARAFSAYVRSSDGQRVLADAGFGKP